jgi:hypothetical protein
VPLQEDSAFETRIVPCCWIQSGCSEEDTGVGRVNALTVQDETLKSVARWHMRFKLVSATLEVGPAMCRSARRPQNRERRYYV